MRRLPKAFVRAVTVAVAGLTLSSGCASSVAGKGTNLAHLTTRFQVHEALGEPTDIQSAEGRVTDVYSTRRKIAEPGNGMSYVALDLATLGLAEVVLLPYELGKACHRSLAGQRLEFTYDRAGGVTEVRFNGLFLEDRWQSGYSFTRKTISSRVPTPPTGE